MPRHNIIAPTRLIEDENSAHLFPKFLDLPSASIFEPDYCICGIDPRWRKVIVMALDSLTRWDSFNNHDAVRQIERLIYEIDHQGD